MIDNGIQIAFDFFGVGVLFIFGAALLFGAVQYVKDLLG